MLGVNEIRAKFLEFFASKNHETVKSYPLVPHNDPSLMFTNAGMVQFKDVFIGSDKRAYKTAVSSQKCVRAGGKHNDLDNVGYTARHHTFFEMLGNFSFGDYFKQDAIKYAWEFLTKVLNLPTEKLFITVYHEDEEAFKIWQQVSGFSDDKILKVATSDNFWSMGDTGPCGPCSEIFYDHGDSIEGQWKLDKDGNDLFGDRFIEIWNLVFMQFERLGNGEQINLPKPSIDTGMGLERISAILQNKHNNYDIDLFANLIKSIEEITGNKEPEKIASRRVIADHLRSISFLISDGVFPSNEGRGYVLRRIMRRAMRHARNLNCTKPIIYKLVPSLINEMGESYNELKRAENLITETIKLEEEKFGETLDRGLKLLVQETQNLKSGDVLKGEIAFKLYDTYGFPFDLTVDILRGKNLLVDEAGFNESMQKQKDMAKAAWKGSGADATDELWFDLKEKFGETDFNGYKSSEIKAKILAIIVDGKIVDFVKNSTSSQISLMLSQTVAYAESGGQEGDWGVISNCDGSCIFNLSDTKKKLGLHIHLGEVAKGIFKTGDEVLVKIDENRRKKLNANHSVTHILHSVLREHLGSHVTQKGSLVAQDKLRFDFSHSKALTEEDIFAIERKVNQIIRQSSNVETKLMDSEQAIKSGAMALFGEKYDDEVRVVSMGRDKYSIELCGGTHVANIGKIGLFKITSESAIASGVRRIEAVTADIAIEYSQQSESQLSQILKITKSSQAEIVEKVNALLEDKKQLTKEIAVLKKQIALGGSGSEKTEVEKINGVNFIGQKFTDIPAKELRSIVADLQKKFDSGVVVVASSFEGKSSLIIAVSDDLTNKINAAELVKSCYELIGAKGGGGKPNFAQTGGNNIDRFDEVIDVVRGGV